MYRIWHNGDNEAIPQKVEEVLIALRTLSTHWYKLQVISYCILEG